MDIGVDQSVPRGDLKLLPDGRYIYINPITNKFDIDRFSRYYQPYRDLRNKHSAMKLKELNAPNNTIKIDEPYKNNPLNKPIGILLVDTKDSLFNTMDDLLKYGFQMDTFTKDNRLFYLGITLIFIAALASVMNT